MNLIRLSDYLDRPAIVQEKNQYKTFKITPIGGAKEIAAWREDQAKKLAALNLKREELKNKQVTTIAGADAPLGELTWQGKAMLADPMAWEQKLLAAKAERRRLYKKTEPEPLPKLAYEFEPEPKPSWTQRLKNWFVGLFIS
jgi:hypothetical protein